MSKSINNYFLILFSLIPLSILVGPAFSLINILIIDISFLIMIIRLKDFSFLKSDTSKYFIILYIYLIINTLFSIDQYSGIGRNLGFFRMIILFFAINYFFKSETFFKKVFFMWFLIISIVVFDVYFENFTGKNILGFESKNYGRIVSFFKDELIVGGYLYGFSLILIGYLSDTFKKRYLNLILLFLLIILIAIVLTGERSNSIKALIGFTVLYLFISNYSLKKKIISLLLAALILIFTIASSEALKLRFFEQIKKYSQISNNYYFHVYKSGIEVFKNYPVMGVGNKNYRVETCNDLSEQRDIYVCTTHPHQIYIEFLSEHGIVGSFLLFFIFYKMIFSKIGILRENIDGLKVGNLIYLTLVFLPLIPSGAFFSDYMLTFFVLHISILYATSPKLNIFLKKNY